MFSIFFMMVPKPPSIFSVHLYPFVSVTCPAELLAQQLLLAVTMLSWLEGGGQVEIGEGDRKRERGKVVATAGT